MAQSEMLTQKQHAKKQTKDKVTTVWTFARGGVVYISFPLTVVDTALLIKLNFINNYGLLLVFLALAATGTFVGMILFGKLHYEKSPYAKDTVIGVMNNPYTWAPTPGLWKDVVIPSLEIAVRNSADSVERTRLLELYQKLRQGESLREIT